MYIPAGLIGFIGGVLVSWIAIIFISKFGGRK